MGFAAGFAAGADAKYKKEMLRLTEQEMQLKQQQLQQQLQEKAYTKFTDLVTNTENMTKEWWKRFNEAGEKLKKVWVSTDDPVLRQKAVDEYNRVVGELNTKAQNVVKITNGFAKRLGVDDSLLEQFNQIVPKFPAIGIEETKDGKVILKEFDTEGKVLNAYETTWDKIKAMYSPQEETKTSSEFKWLLERRKELISKLKQDPNNKLLKDELSHINKRLSKMEQPSMAAIQKDLETYKSEELSVAEELGVSPNKLATIDIRQLPEEQKSRLSELAYTWIRAYKPKVAAKALGKIETINQAIGQIGEAFSITDKDLQNKNKINFFAKVYREYLGKYFGMPESQYLQFYRDSRFKGAINVIRHGLFGSALTKNEKEEFLEYIPSLYSENKTIVLGMKSLLSDQKRQLDIIKREIGIKPFNWLYGDVYRNLNELLQLIDKSIKGKTKKEKKVINLTEKYRQHREPAWKKYLGE